jgi:RNA polymerase sigma factor (sigma-70 family)
MDAAPELISKCLKHDLASQHKFYHRYAPKMFGICQRYARNETEAEDILQIGFLRVFTNLHQYRSEGSLEGWIMRIIINAAINYNKQQLKTDYEVSLEELSHEATLPEDALSFLSVQEIIEIIQTLPAGHRMVFSLHEIEGYEHKEIAVMLGIAEGTSKSQLFRARATIKRRMQELEKVQVKII